MQTQNILALVSASMGTIGLVLFFRLIGRYPNESAALAQSKPGPAVNFVVMFPLVLAAFFGNYIARVISVVSLILFVIIGGWYNRRWLLKNGAERSFLNGMLLPSCFGVLSVALLVAAVILGFEFSTLFVAGWRVWSKSVA